MKRKLILILLSLFILAGLYACGNGDGDLIGSLTMSSALVNDTGGYYHATSTATYTHPTKDPVGTEITYSEYIYTPTQLLSNYVTTKKVSSSGTVTFTTGIVQQGTEPVFIDLRTQTGALTQYQLLVVPQVGALSVTPTAIPYQTTDPIGTAKTVTIAGGVSPYTASSSTPDLGVSVSGTSVTITNNVIVTGTRSATITIVDSSGKSATVLVGY